MQTRSRITALLACCGAVCGVWFFSNSTGAQDVIGNMEDRGFNLRVLPISINSRLESNRLIDCSTNIAYRSGPYGDYIASLVSTAAGGGPVDHTKLSANCKSCHRSIRPTVGVGDRPATPFASFSLSNYTGEAQKFYLYAGEKGEGKWVEHKIGPGKVQPFTWPYSNPSDRRSPVFWINYEGETFRVMPLATPNKNIGSLYYFASSNDRSPTHLLKANQPYRAGR